MVIHYWPAFWIVVCLGLIQITATCYSSILTVESMPSHVPAARRRRHTRHFLLLYLFFFCLTLALAKVNDSNQYRSEVSAQQERVKQEALRTQLKQTFESVMDSQLKLQQLKAVVDAHEPGAERSEMLDSINQMQSNLQRQADTSKH